MLSIVSRSPISPLPEVAGVQPASVKSTATLRGTSWPGKQRRIFGHGFRFTEHADITVISLKIIGHRLIQTQRTSIWDRIYRILFIRRVIA